VPDDANDNADDFDASIFKVLLDRGEAMVKAGVPVDDAAQHASDALQAGLDAAAPDIVAELIKTAPDMVVAQRRENRAFERRLRRHWGAALDRFYSVAVAAEEAASIFDVRRSKQVVGQNFQFEALTGIMARACRTAFEVHHLLLGGFPLGALARCRTLHELAVYAIVINDRGKPEGEIPDLGERYLLHRAVLNWTDALIFQEHYLTLGEEPFSDDDFAAMKHERDALVARYGTNYKESHGWAAGLVPSGRPHFVALESLANVSHLRGHYKWASHEVHADAKGWAMNEFQAHGVNYRATGRMNTGLAEPGHLALISLHQCLVSLLLSTDEPSPWNMLACMTLQPLVDDAGDLFAKGARSVAVAYEGAESRRLREQQE
jgi:Family of unknown function (DUF5677)